MLLVDHDETWIFERREHGGTGAEDYWRFSVTRGEPGIQALLIVQPRVQHRDRNAKTPFKTANQLGSEADFRHQRQRLLSLCQHWFDHIQIDLSFTATGDTVQQVRLEAAEIRGDRDYRGLLSRIELWLSFGIAIEAGP